MSKNSEIITGLNNRTRQKIWNIHRACKKIRNNHLPKHRTSKRNRNIHLAQEIRNIHRASKKNKKYRPCRQPDGQVKKFEISTGHVKKSEIITRSNNQTSQKNRNIHHAAQDIRNFYRASIKPRNIHRLCPLGKIHRVNNRACHHLALRSVKKVFPLFCNHTLMTIIVITLCNHPLWLTRKQAYLIFETALM